MKLMRTKRKHVEISKVYEKNKLLLPRLPQNEDFLSVTLAVFRFARWFGIPTYGAAGAALWCVFQLSTLVAIELGALYKVGRLISGIAICTAGGRSIVGRLSGTIFYGNALVSFILSWKLVANWKPIANYWAMTEHSTALYIPPDLNLKKHLTIILWIVVVSSIEHSLSMMSATGFSIPASEYFQKYILTSHGFLLRPDEYSLWLAVPIFVCSKTATCLWNFQDTVIILMSAGLASRYRRLNQVVETQVKRDVEAMGFGKPEASSTMRVVAWRRIREAFVRQAALVRRIDRALGGLILLSNLNNFYFICLQFYLGIGGERPMWYDKLYYLFSVSWLCTRACGVVLAGARVQLHSGAARAHLHAYPAALYNVETHRLQRQLCKDYVALSGLGFFYLDRSLLLQVAAAILTYELVLLQYDTTDGSE